MVYMNFVLIIFIWIFFSFGMNHPSFYYFLRGNSLWITSTFPERIMLANQGITVCANHFSYAKSRAYCTFDLYFYILDIYKQLKEPERTFKESESMKFIVSFVKTPF
jgi:hypothetical protein